MSTSDPSGSAAPGVSPGVGSAVDFAAMAGEVSRLANEFFGASPLAAGGAPAAGLPAAAPVSSVPALPSAVPGPLPPPRLGPSALNGGGGGMTATQHQPPMPGFLHTPPLASSPVPGPADVRPAPTQLAEFFGGPTPLEIMLSADQRSPSATPYFLDHAGLPDGLSMPSALPSVPSAPAAIPGGVGTGTPSLPDGSSAPSAPTAIPGVSTAIPGVSTAIPGAPTASSVTSPSYSPELVPDLGSSSSPGMFDAASIKKDFPILEERVHGNKRLIWLDNAATTQKPQAVIDRLSYFYEHENSNIHRAAHTLAARATDAYEGARERVRRFLNAPSVKEIVFTRGATEAINLVAKAWGGRNIKAGDEIVLTVLEHHANIVPWQQLAAEKGAKIRVAPVDSDGQIILEEYEKLFNPRTRIASFTQVSNALGTITPAREMVEIAHRHGALVLVDGAQTVSHQRVDVQALDADFYVFSGHKVFGPTGIGALFGKAAVLEHMPPWQGGGNMIADVTFEKTVYQPPPFRFEAGTGNIADAVGLGAAIDYVMGIGLENISRYEHELLVYATEGLCRIPGLTMIGTAPDKAGVLSFVLDGLRTEDVGAALDKEGIAVRSGHHCAQPILRRFGLEATVRASLAPYNTKEDIDALVSAVTRLSRKS